MLISGGRCFHHLMKSPALKPDFHLFLSLYKEVKNKTALREGVHTPTSNSQTHKALPTRAVSLKISSLPQPPSPYWRDTDWILQAWDTTKDPHFHPILSTGMGFPGSGTMKNILPPCISGRWPTRGSTAAIPFSPLVMAWRRTEHQWGGAITRLRKA